MKWKSRCAMVHRFCLYSSFLFAGSGNTKPGLQIRQNLGVHPFSRPSLSPLTQGAEDRESSGVSRECEGMQRLN